MNSQSNAAEPAESVVSAFAGLYGAAPTGVWSSPGRVNLIGEHTDYNNGFVMPLAIPDRVTVAASRNDGRVLRIASAQQTEKAEIDLDKLEPGSVEGWGAYVAGVAWALQQKGFTVPGADLYLDGRVPLGAGLSSSAALECAVAVALIELAELPEPPRGLAVAQLAQFAENEYVGAKTGLMDQAASILCTEGHALLFDVLNLSTQQVPFDLDGAGLALVVIDTRVTHSHAGGEYGERRASCEAAAAALGVDSLRLATVADLDRLTDPLLLKRARHIVTENDRVVAAGQAMSRDDWAEFGRLMTASHASMRDDFEITCTEIDVAVEISLENGAIGARMTGGGFGGSSIALVSQDKVAVLSEAVLATFAERGFKEPVIRTMLPSRGASRDR
ncbi:galactokinase [Kineosporia rhizophila]|uniref:galactokinase n=1 Tax=Kineosporia TaxID=49184 RepID=UPI001E60EEE8|nr:galactokinase [Kineosporia sp. NBRC 101677]MCE0539206.1 galactokinase [Kineosporia rhizophila]GLY14526.1 galactokinase [Kineosporia sp. NBRC 101677]